MIKKVIAAIAVFIVLGLVWFFTQGPGKTLIDEKLHPQAVDVGTAATPTAAPVYTQAPAAPPPGFQPSADTLKSIKANGLVRVSNQDNDAPFYSSDGGAHGFDVDFTKMLFSDSSFTSDAHPFVSVDFAHSVPEYAQVPKQLRVKDGNGNYVTDIGMAGLTFPDNKPAGVKYTVPYIDNFGYALIVKNGSPIKTTADLAGKTVGILKGDPDVKAFVTHQYPGANFIEVDDADTHFIDHSIDSGKVDAFIYDYPFAVEAIKNTDLTFAITSLDGSNLSYKIAVRADDDTLLVYLNAAIAKAKQSDDYKLLLLKYFQSNQVITTGATGGEHTYTVKTGDTLFKIAQAKMGDGNRYRELQKRNNLPNPNLIAVGQNLVIPRK